MANDEQPDEQRGYCGPGFYEVFTHVLEQMAEVEAYVDLARAAFLSPVDCHDFRLPCGCVAHVHLAHVDANVFVPRSPN